MFSFAFHSCPLTGFADGLGALGGASGALKSGSLPVRGFTDSCISASAAALPCVGIAEDEIPRRAPRPARRVHLVGAQEAADRVPVGVEPLREIGLPRRVPPRDVLPRHADDAREVDEPEAGRAPGRPRRRAREERVRVGLAVEALDRRLAERRDVAARRIEEIVAEAPLLVVAAEIDRILLVAQGLVAGGISRAVGGQVAARRAAMIVRVLLARLAPARRVSAIAGVEDDPRVLVGAHAAIVLVREHDDGDERVGPQEVFPLGLELLIVRRRLDQEPEPALELRLEAAAVLPDTAHQIAQVRLELAELRLVGRRAGVPRVPVEEAEVLYVGTVGSPSSTRATRWP